MAGEISSMSPIPKLRVNPKNRMDIVLGNGVSVDPEKIQSMILPGGKGNNFKIALKSGDTLEIKSGIRPEYVQGKWNEATENLKNPARIDLFA